MFSMITNETCFTLSIVETISRDSFDLSHTKHWRKRRNILVKHYTILAVPEELDK